LVSFFRIWKINAKIWGEIAIFVTIFENTYKINFMWDYGYQIAGMANRTTLVDNNTVNVTKLATLNTTF
jgi:asparagine N-glycosylation enzyme membrane subunit Stt3